MATTPANRRPVLRSSYCGGWTSRAHSKRFADFPVALGLAAALSFAAGAAAPESDFQARLSKAKARFMEGAKTEAVATVSQLIQEQPTNSRAWFLRGLFYEAEREFPKAVSDYDQALKLPGSEPAIYHQRGLSYFSLGQFEKAVADFTRFIELRPKEEPFHWQRGIAYYYAGRFQEARRQFELHQTVNSNDVENAVWHWLSVARVDGVEKARATLLPIRHDARVPMDEVYALYAGQGSEEGVRRAVEALESGSSARETAEFYANLYLGFYDLFREAQDQAATRFAGAASHADRFGFMGEVARIQSSQLSRGKAPAQK